ncbi:MarR family transcriptional regulator [Rhodococcus sp. Z13]|uniref:MarR family transcriptional regulator n=1 Tax=Rhodococcus sacchari TaxID=2962047 RepID=A0ACD4DF42_9NOCA|nr:MarR family transcriptional regulator [Rhodococcus sp. Z13]UYP18622.1 MarR family transcriptional regulator [Rhodococcus sp. Z13]
METPDGNLAQSLREALRPLWRRLNANKTLSMGKIDVLARLERGPATSADLATAARISPQAIATAVRELESLGLVGRTPDDRDRRRVWIELTEAGRERLAQERAIGNAWLEQALTEQLTPEEQKLLASAVPLLRKLTGGAAGE